MLLKNNRHGWVLHQFFSFFFLHFLCQCKKHTLRPGCLFSIETLALSPVLLSDICSLKQIGLKCFGMQQTQKCRVLSCKLHIVVVHLRIPMTVHSIVEPHYNERRFNKIILIPPQLALEANAPKFLPQRTILRACFASTKFWLNEAELSNLFYDKVSITPTI